MFTASLIESKFLSFLDKKMSKQKRWQILKEKYPQDLIVCIDNRSIRQKVTKDGKHTKEVCVITPDGSKHYIDVKKLEKLEKPRLLFKLKENQ